MTDTPNLDVVRKQVGWRIVGYYEVTVGPYPTKPEAENDMRGLLRFEKYQNRKGFITSEKAT